MIDDPIEARIAWLAQAACKVYGPKPFFSPDDGDGRERTPDEYWDLAREICSGCPVFVQCLDETLSVPLFARDRGFRSGLTPGEIVRYHIRRRHAK